jgi:hypothetical protein
MTYKFGKFKMTIFEFDNVECVVVDILNLATHHHIIGIKRAN